MNYLSFFRFFASPLLRDAPESFLIFYAFIGTVFIIVFYFGVRSR